MIFALNRAFSGFLLFLLALCITFAAGVWWLGPAVVSLAVDGERRAAPYYVLHLASVPESVDSSGYFERLRQLVGEEQGQLLWRGRLAAVHSGRLTDERDDLLIYEFATGGDLVQMLTSATYRDLADQAPSMLLGSILPPAAMAQDETLLVWLLDLREASQNPDERHIGPTNLDRVMQTALRFDGQVIWSAPIDPIAGDANWNYLVILGFPDPAALADCFADSTTVTEFALARRSVAAQTLLEFSARQ